MQGMFYIDYFGGAYMRRNRISRRRKKSKDKLWFFLIFFVIVPIISINLGLALVKYIILPRFNEADENNVQIQLNNMDNTEENISNDEIDVDKEYISQSKKSNKFELQDITMYNVQVGSFSSKENAKICLEQVKENDMVGYIIKMKNYKVIVGTFLNRQSADNFINQTKENFEDVFIDENHIKTKQINYSENEKEYLLSLESLIKIINNAYETETDILARQIISKDITTFLNKFKENNISIKEEIEKLSNDEANEDIDILIKDINNNVNQRLNLLDNIDSEEISNVYTEYYKVLVNYINLIKAN